MSKIKTRDVEWGVLISAIMLMMVGIVALFSASGEESGFEECKKQIIWGIIGLIFAFGITLIDYKFITKLSVFLYPSVIILLVGVLFTTSINGATSWYNIGPISFQPSELGKIVIILSLAKLISYLKKIDNKGINKFWKIASVLALVGVPIFLIIKQPDYGTAICFLVILALMLYISGLKLKYIIISFIILVIGCVFAYFFILPEHAVNRIKVFLNPGLDPTGIGYNVLQSKLAIGAGKITGMGLLKGNQTQLGYLYPKTTDFIFSVIAEELGFIVAGGIIFIYLYLIIRTIYISKTSKDFEGSLIAIGISGIFIFHMVENIGMTMGLLPITGVPLPFVSYGGSSLITNFICIGLLLNVSGRRQKVMFMS